MLKKIPFSSVKEWFTVYENRQEGPFSQKELMIDVRLTPETLVWKKGMKDWIKVKEVQELKFAFEDHTEVSEKDEEEFNEVIQPKFEHEEETLTMQMEPYQYSLWILIILIVLIYILFQIYN